MADPISALAIGSLVATAGSSVIGAMGASNAAAGKVAQDQSMAAQAAYQSAVARNNAIIATRNAEHVGMVGYQRAEIQSMKTAQTVGEQRATFAAHGVDVNSGSPLDVRASTTELGKLDIMTIINDASSKAAGYRAQATNFESDAQLGLLKQSGYQTAAKYDETAGDYAVAGSLIGGASSFSDKWLGYQQKGVFA